MSIPFVRASISAALLVALLTISHAGARAADVPYEVCPADAEMVAMSDSTAPSSTGATSYALTLEGGTARTVTGTVTVFASDKWYAIAFSNIPLLPYVENYTADLGNFARTDYLSRDEVVQFPNPVTVEYAYVSSASASDETLVGWGAKGKVTCASAGLFSKWGIHQRAVGELTLQNPRAVPQELGFGLGLKAVPIPAPGPTNCDVPFAWAQVIKAVKPAYPAGSYARTGLSVVDVGINADGSVDDGWLWGRSGDTELDTSALQGAGASTYAPARAFCANVKGMFRYFAEFDKQ